MLPGERRVVREWIEKDMPHTCTILRQQVEGRDPYRRPIYGDHTPYMTGVPCFYYFSSGGESRDARRTVAEYTYWLQLPRSVDIGQDDRIADIMDEEGSLQATAEMAVQSIGPRATNWIVQLREVRDAV